MREAVFAGSFYSSDPAELRDQFKDVQGLAPVSAFGLIAPHAGHVYSGRTALRTLKSVHIPEIVIILCPNHRGLGQPISVSPDQAWNTPLGPVEIDQELSSRIVESDDASWDRDAHRMEHSLEVQLPLLQLVRPDVKIVAISIGTGDTGVLDRFSTFLGSLVEPGKHLLLASSDMSHFLSAAAAKQADAPVIERIVDLDPEGMLREVLQNSVSMCGVFPGYVMMRVARMLGASHAEVVEYTHSGVVTGDHGDVVAYLGVRIW